MTFWDIATTSHKGVLDIFVYGDIKTNRDFFGSPDDVITREFISDLQKYPNVNRINVHINSGGGEVFAAVAMAQQLKKHKAEIHTYVEGVAASAATIIAMAGDVRHMTVSSLYMIHLPSTQVSGNKHGLVKGIEVLEKVEDIIRMTYQNKTKLTDAQLTEMLEHETWLTAHEAKQYGFISEIEEDPDEEEEDDPEKKLDRLITDVQADIISINGVELKVTAYTDPEQLRAKLITIKNSQGGMTMDFQAILNTLPDDQRAKLLAAIENQVAEKTGSLTQQVTSLTSQLASVTDQLSQAQEAAHSAEARAKAAEEQVTQLQDTTDEDTKFLNSLPSDARKAVLEARRVAAEAQAQVATLQNAAEYNNFLDSLNQYGNLPLNDAHKQALFNIKNANPEDYATIEALFSSAEAALDVANSSIGDDIGGEAPTDAYDQLDQIANKKMADNEGMTYNDAFREAVRENPALYDQYRDNIV